MAFLKFNIADNAVGNLDADILASTTTITLGTGEGAVFPASNFIATLVQYDTPTDPTTEVIKSEKILVSSRSGDILTCTRGYDGDSATTFSTGDYIYLNVVSKVIKDIQDEVVQVRTDLNGDIADLNTNKLNIVGGTRTGLTSNRILKTNASGVEGYLPFGANGTVLTGTGTTTDPTWSTPTVSIVGLTAETTPTTSDLAIIYDDSSSTNKKTTLANLTKGLSPATTSAKGTVEMATDAEASAGTDQIRYVNPKQVKDNWENFFINRRLVPSDNLRVSSDEQVEATGVGATWSTVKTYNVPKNILPNSSIRIKFDLSHNNVGNNFNYRYSQYDNFNRVWTTASNMTYGSSWSTKTLNLPFNPGDIIRIELLNYHGFQEFIRNFRIYFDYQISGIDILGTAE